ncbi:hypothetical protein BH11ARM2_BH11ARM2_11890 [soil metagenome]
MTDSQKKGALIVVTVLAVLAAGFGAMSAMQGEKIKPGVSNALPPGSKTGKQLEMGR